MVDSRVLGWTTVTRKIHIEVNKYEKGNSFEASHVARALTSVEIQRDRCVDILALPTPSDSMSDVLARVFDDLKKPNSDPQDGSFRLSAFVAEELARLDDQEVRRYLYHRYRYDVFPSQRSLDDYPPYVQIEPTSICNFRCVFCYQTDESFSNRQSEHMGSMTLETFKRIVDEIEGNVEFVSLASRGEPLMCRDLPAMLNFAFGKFLNLKVNTNASILTEERSHALLSGSVRTVVFSADAAEEPLYSQLRVNGKLEKVLRNIERFEQIRQDQYPDSKVITRVSGVFVNKEQDLEKMIKLWGGMVDQISFVRYNPWENVYQAPPSNVIAPCSDLWRRLFIWFDGRVNPCDTDYKSELSVGDIWQNDIRAIWSGPDYQALRVAHQSEKRSSLHPCRNCVVV